PHESGGWWVLLDSFKDKGSEMPILFQAGDIELITDKSLDLARDDKIPFLTQSIPGVTKTQIKALDQQLFLNNPQKYLENLKPTCGKHRRTRGFK
ncbi:MAG: hypothetical protein ACRDEA_21980, partial [Microcystaceae cyanobacterium]